MGQGGQGPWALEPGPAQPGGPRAVGAGAWARAAWAWAEPGPGPGPGGARAKTHLWAEDGLDGDLCVDSAAVVTYFHPNNSPGDGISQIQEIIFGPGRHRAARGGPGPSGRAGLGWGRNGPALSRMDILQQPGSNRTPLN